MYMVSMETLQAHDASTKTRKKPKVISFSSRYNLVRPLEEGGTSSLLLAKDRHCFNSLVVLKCIHANLLQLDSTRDIAKVEFSNARQLSHPNLINIFDYLVDKGLEYLVMEYVDGDTLKSHLSRRKLNYVNVIQILDSLVGVLSFLHQKGIVHSDVKPANIMISTNNVVKLIDLANCRQDHTIKNPGVVVPGDQFFGYSLDYSSPQVINDEPATASDDVFSLACVMYEMFEGKSPISSNKLSSDYSLIPSSKPRDINRLQWKVLKRAMSTSSEKRYQSIEVFYRHFKLAKKLPVIALSLVALSFIMAFFAAIIFDEVNASTTEITKYKSVYEKQLAVDELISTIKMADPLARYEHLSNTSSLSESIKTTVLNAVHDDVVLPITHSINKDGVFNLETKEITDLRAVLTNLAQFYPNSKQVYLANSVIDNEIESIFDRLLFDLQQVFNNEEFNKKVGSQISSSLSAFYTLNPSYDNTITDFIDMLSYKPLVDEALFQADWQAIANLYEFASEVKQYLPQLFLLWANANADLVSHSLIMSEYIKNNSHMLKDFPIDSGKYFFESDLLDLQKKIIGSFYNKDIKRHADQLLLIKQLYHVPDNLPVYMQTSEILLSKINEKSLFHKRKGQVKTMKWLDSLAEKHQIEVGN